MKEQGIFSAFTFSLFMHVLIVAITGIIARHSMTFRLPSPYVVSLVDVSNFSGASGSRTGAVAASRAEEPAKGESRSVQHMTEKPTKREEERVDERISALQAKKRLEKMVALRKVVDIGTHKAASQGGASNALARSGKSEGGAPGGGSYESLVQSKIRQQWSVSDLLAKELEAIVSIKIAKDGSVTIDKMEKSSGNRLFDKSVLSAIYKANPLPPPPQEMEMGLRFKP